MPQPDLSAYPPVQQAIADLAERLGVDPAAITVVRVEEVDWPDGGLGCPQPGMVYTQALVNGSFIQLEAEGRTYNYHSGGMRPRPTSLACRNVGQGCPTYDRRQKSRRRVPTPALLLFSHFLDRLTACTSLHLPGSSELPGAFDVKKLPPD